MNGLSLGSRRPLFGRVSLAVRRICLVPLVWTNLISVSFGLTVPATEDTTGTQTRITTAASNASMLTVDASRRAYLYFNLDNVPQNAVVRFAHLRLYIPSLRQRGAGATVHKVLGQWNEAIASAEPTSESNPVAGFEPGQLGSRRFVTVDVTAVVREWISGSAENEGLVIKAKSPVDSKGQTASFTVSSKEGPFTGLPAHLEIELLDESAGVDPENPVFADPVTFAQLSQDIKDLLTPAFKPVVTLSEGVDGRKLQLEAFGVFGPKGVSFQWFKDGKVVDLGRASTVDGNVVRVDTALLSSGSYSVLASNGPATRLSDPILVSNSTVDLSNGLILHMPFDGNARDTSGKNNHGTVDGATLAKDRFGTADRAYFFNGNSRIKVDHNPALNAYPITVSCWFQTTDPNPGHMVEKYENATWNGWGLAVEDVGYEPSPAFKAAATGFLMRTRQNYMIGGYDGQPTFGGGGPLNDGVWHQAVMVVDGSSGRIFVDGKLVDTQSWVGPAGSPTGGWPLYIGHRPRNLTSMGDFNPDFKGSIDDVRIYGRALSDVEVLALYDLEKPLPLTESDFVTVKSVGPVTLGQPDGKGVSFLFDDFLIARDEMTYGKWTAIVTAAKQKLSWTLPKGTAGSAYGTETAQHPVTGVSPLEVALWCNAASILGKLEPCYFTFSPEGQKVPLSPETAEFASVRGLGWEKGANGYRLPTGDEWEVAARGGLEGKLYPWGDEPPSKLNSNWIFAADYPSATTPVGSYPRNGYGLSDCSGNVYEMTWDTSLAPGENPPDVIKVSMVTRGGAWNQGHAPKISGLGWEIAISWERSQVNGFRVARNVPKSFDMVEIPGGTNVPLGFPASSPEVPVSIPRFRMGRDEVTFARWSAVVTAAKEKLGWTLAGGVQGSGSGNLTSQHPVTNVTFQEVALWLNAASKLEGLEPAYSTFDASGNVVPLTPETQSAVNDRGIHWKKTAGGYRFPTGDEWEVAARGGLKSRTYPWGDENPSRINANWVVADGYPNATTPVGSYARNGYGLSDCAGNVFEMTWDTSLAPGGPVPDVIKGNAIVRGGAWNQGYPPKISGYGWDLPISWDKRTEYGFRIAQNSPATKFELVDLPGQVAVKLGFPAYSPTVAVSVPGYRIAKNEMTFGLWTSVVKEAKDKLLWTLSDGVRGSGEANLTDQHPVTCVTFLDVALWCNAASKLHGLSPVYSTFDAGGSPVALTPQTQGFVDQKGIFWNKTANGYRLPTGDEWEIAARGGTENRTYPWGDEVPSTKNSNWIYAAGYPMTTTSVGSYSRNGFGLSDCSGNVYEMTWDNGLPPGEVVPDILKGSAIVRGGAWNQGYPPKISGLGWELPISADKRPEYGFRLAQNAGLPE